MPGKELVHEDKKAMAVWQIFTGNSSIWRFISDVVSGCSVCRIRCKLAAGDGTSMSGSAGAAEAERRKVAFIFPEGGRMFPGPESKGTKKVLGL